MAIRAATEADIPVIMGIERSPGFERFVGRSGKSQHRTMMATDDCRYIILENDAGETQGFAILQGIGSANAVIYLKRIAVGTPSRGTGKAFLKDLIRLSFEDLGAEKFWLDAFVHNERARHVYAACSLREDGILREHYPFEGGRADLVIMSILKREWKPD